MPESKPPTNQSCSPVNKIPAGVCGRGVPLFEGADVQKHMCTIEVATTPPTHAHTHTNTHVPPSPSHSLLFGRIKREHLFRQLVSVTGGMQPRAEVTERFWFVHKKAACRDRVTPRLESGAG